MAVSRVNEVKKDSYKPKTAVSSLDAVLDALVLKAQQFVDEGRITVEQHVYFKVDIDSIRPRLKHWETIFSDGRDKGAVQQQKQQQPQVPATTPVRWQVAPPPATPVTGKRTCAVKTEVSTAPLCDPPAWDPTASPPLVLSHNVTFLHGSSSPFSLVDDMSPPRRLFSAASTAKTSVLATSGSRVAGAARSSSAAESEEGGRRGGEQQPPIPPKKAPAGPAVVSVGGEVGDPKSRKVLPEWCTTPSRHLSTWGPPGGKSVQGNGSLLPCEVKLFTPTFISRYPHLLETPTTRTPEILRPPRLPTPSPPRTVKLLEPADPDNLETFGGGGTLLRPEGAHAHSDSTPPPSLSPPQTCRFISPSSVDNFSEDGFLHSPGTMLTSAAAFVTPARRRDTEVSVGGGVTPGLWAMTVGPRSMLGKAAGGKVLASVSRMGLTSATKRHLGILGVETEATTPGWNVARLGGAMTPYEVQRRQSFDRMSDELNVEDLSPIYHSGEPARQVREVYKAFVDAEKEAEVVMKEVGATSIILTMPPPGALTIHELRERLPGYKEEILKVLVEALYLKRFLHTHWDKARYWFRPCH